MPAFQRPADSQYAPFYTRYVAAVPEGDVVAFLDAQAHDVAALLGHLDDEGARFRYAPGKWSVKDVLAHLTDAERIFAYRLLRIARGDATPLPGFEENAYAEAAHADARPLADLLGEFAAVRHSTVLLLRGLPDEAPTRAGVASGQPVTVQALAYILAGHAHHHLGVLRERYGLGPATAS